MKDGRGILENNFSDYMNLDNVFCTCALVSFIDAIFKFQFSVKAGLYNSRGWQNFMLLCIIGKK